MERGFGGKLQNRKTQIIFGQLFVYFLVCMMELVRLLTSLSSCTLLSDGCVFMNFYSFLLDLGL